MQCLAYARGWRDTICNKPFAAISITKAVAYIRVLMPCVKINHGRSSQDHKFESNDKLPSQSSFQPEVRLHKWGASAQMKQAISAKAANHSNQFRKADLTLQTVPSCYIPQAEGCDLERQSLRYHLLHLHR